MSSFGPIAAFYDDLMQGVPYRMWVDYYRLLLEQLEAHPKRLLDVCCGTGNVAERLTDHGFIVAGIDLSPTMIEEARRKATEQSWDIRYEAADAAEFDLGETFDGAYSFFDSLNYITDLGHLQRALNRVAAHLTPGGTFVFDLNTAYAFEQRMFDQQDTRKKARVQYNWVGNYDEPSRIIRVQMEFWVEGIRVTEEHVQRAHRQEEMQELLERAGFGEIRVYDSYTLDPPRRRSDRNHYTARYLP